MTQQDPDRALRKQLRYESLFRRLAHPDWPSHYHTKTNADGIVIHSMETLPVKKLHFVGRCRHCHEVHPDWWLMDQRGYYCEGHPMILCAKCHQVMSQVYADLAYVPPSGKHGH